MNIDFQRMCSAVWVVAISGLLAACGAGSSPDDADAAAVPAPADPPPSTSTPRAAQAPAPPVATGPWTTLDTADADVRVRYRVVGGPIERLEFFDLDVEVMPGDALATAPPIDAIEVDARMPPTATG